jgi:hypothetical protein
LALSAAPARIVARRWPVSARCAPTASAPARLSTLIESNGMSVSPKMTTRPPSRW